MQTRPAGRSVLCPDASRVRVDQRFGDREAESGPSVAGARVVRPVEPVEDVREIGFRQSWSAVANADFDLLGALDRGDRDRAAFGGVTDRVGEEVEEDLFNPLAIDDDRREVGGDPAVESDARVLELNVSTISSIRQGAT